MLIKGYVSIENVNTRYSYIIQYTQFMKSWKVWRTFSFYSFFIFFFFFFYLKNHHVTNRRFRRSISLGPDKRNLSHVFRRVSKDRKFFQRIPRDYW